MAGRKFEAGEKRVQKMSREGLTEKKLHTGESISISRKFEGGTSARMDVQEEQPVRIRTEIDGSGEEKAGSRKRRRQQRMKNAEPAMEVSASGQQPGTVQEETIARASPLTVTPEPLAVSGVTEQPSYQATEVEHSHFSDERQHYDLNREPYNTGQPMEEHLREQHQQGVPESGEKSVIEEPVRGKEEAFSEKPFQETETAVTAEPVREKKVALAAEPLRETEPTFAGEAIRDRPAMPVGEKPTVSETQDRRFGGFSESILERSRDREELYEAKPAEVENGAVDYAEGNTRLKSHSARMDRMGKRSEESRGKSKRKKNQQRQSRKNQASNNEGLETETVQAVADDSVSVKPIQLIEVDSQSVQAQKDLLRPQEEGFVGSIVSKDKETLVVETGMSMASSVSKPQNFQRDSGNYSQELNDGDTPMETEVSGDSSGKYSLQTHSARFQAVSGHSARSSESSDVSEAGSNRKRRIRAETAQVAIENAEMVEAPPKAEDTQSSSQKIINSKPILQESTGDEALLQGAADVSALPQGTVTVRSAVQETTNLPVPLSAATDIVPVDADSAGLKPEGLDFNEKNSLKEHSGRLANYRESYSRNGDGSDEETSHERKKAQTQDYQRKAERASSEERKSSGKHSDASQKAAGKSGTDGKSGKKSRLSFDDEQNGMVRGAGMGLGKKAVKGAVSTTSGYVHKKFYEVEQENSGIKAAHRTELVAEGGVSAIAHKLSNRSKVQKKSNRQQRKEKESGKSSRLKFTDAEKEEGAAPGARKKADKNSLSPAVRAQTGGEVSVSVSGKEAVEESKKKNAILNRFWQKRRYKEAYIAAREGLAAAPETAKATQTVTGKAKQIVQSFTKNNKGLLAGVAIFALLFILIATCLSSCTAMFQGVQDSFVSTTYPSTDEDIYAVENAYSALETALNSQINNMETTHPGYDEYRYQVDEISHNPYQLISYLTVVYEEFTYSQVSGILEDLFSQQYTLNVSEEVEIRTRTETRTGTTTSTDPETGETTEEEYEYEVEVEYEYYILNISLVNHGFDTVAQSNLTDDQVSLYSLYNVTYGNRSYLFDTTTLSTYTGSTGSTGSGTSGGSSYEVSAEALSDEKFARMIAEAEKYLGYPYVWGGSSPSTSFDCSGFVCWVINNCGNGWNVGRTTAEGLRSYCTYVSPEDAQPGDLIFFQGTYSTSGASHVGIYVGNGMMIHCGNPIQYTSVQTTYWQSHFLSYGRLN